VWHWVQFASPGAPVLPEGAPALFSAWDLVSSAFSMEDAFELTKASDPMVPARRASNV